MKDYAQHHRLPRGWSVSGHFLEACRLTNLASDAWEADMVCFACAAIFGVKNERLGMIPAACIPSMRTLAQGHYSHGSIFEKPWLHILGLPFITAGHTAMPNHRLAPTRQPNTVNSSQNPEVTGGLGQENR
jgi:hypothetical protein